MKKILAIDDQIDNLITIKAVIKSRITNCDVLTALSGQDGINMAIKEQPDAILLDIIMPNMDGYETCKKLKENELTRHIPVVMVTAIKTDSESRVKGLNLGADAFLSKPIDAIELTAQVNVMLRIKEAEDKLRAEKDLLEELIIERTSALRESEQKYKTLYDFAPIPYQSLNEDGSINDVNPSWLEMLGYIREEVIGELYEHFIHPDDKDVLQKNFPVLKSIGRVHEVPFRLRHKDGHFFDISLEGSSGYYPDGTFKQTYCVFQDITERKKTESENRKLSTAVDQSPSVIAITDLDGNLEYVNHRFLELTEYSIEEVIGKNSRILNSRKQSSEIYKNLWETILSGKVWHGEFHNQKKNGELFWEAASLSPIFNEQGKITNYLKVAEDITERKKVEQIQNVIFRISNAVLTTENLEQLIGLIRKELGTIVDTTNFYLALYDPKTDTLSLPFFSDEYDNYTSLPAEKTITRYVIQSKEPLLANMDTLIKLEELGVIERHGEDSLIWLGVPLKIENEVIGALVVQSYTNEYAYNESDKRMLEFISDQISIAIHRKKADEDVKSALNKAEESDRLKSAFLANMSHEIRTPMNGILGFAELLKLPGLSGDEQNIYINIIEKAGHRMLSIINDIIDISKIESGQMTASMSETNVNEQIQFICNFFKAEVKQKGLQLSFKNDLPSIKAKINTDREKLYAILTNLVKNAIKYTKEGSIEFGYHLKPSEDKGEADKLEFFVRDTGIGIPKDRQEAIFERFIQADIADKMARQGAGLGLAISKAYAEMLGGKIGLESEVGVGSTFYFSIPYLPGDEQKSPEKMILPETVPESKKLNIVIAEDDSTSDFYLTTLVNDISLQIAHAKSGPEIIDICKKNKDIDLILMDIKMPEMNGYEATRKIREFNKQVIIIAQTAYALPGDREKALEAGCNDYIAKPIKKDQLLRLINQYFTR